IVINLVVRRHLNTIYQKKNSSVYEIDSCASRIKHNIISIYKKKLGISILPLLFLSGIISATIKRHQSGCVASLLSDGGISDGEEASLGLVDQSASVGWGRMRYVKPMGFYQELMKSEALKGGRLLGLDVGDKYVGLAISDPENVIASPLSVLLRKKNNIGLMAGDFKKLVSGISIYSLCYIAEIESEMKIRISKFSLAGFIVGYPYDRGCTNDSDAVRIKIFMDALSQTEKLKGLRYTYWDEGFTSKNVELLLKPLALHPLEYKSVSDKFAAVGILQAYLDHINRTKLRPDNEDSC
ncbi:hypothetical protein V2J09_005952, partial [Rumex salicifolius]